MQLEVEKERQPKPEANGLPAPSLCPAKPLTKRGE